MTEALGLASLFVSILCFSFRWTIKGRLQLKKLNEHFKKKPTQKLAKKIERAGLSRESASQHKKKQLLLSTLGLVVGAVLASMGLSLFLPVTLGILGFLWPTMKLNRQIRNRQRSIEMHLPYYLDLTTLALEAGLDLISAIEEILRHDRPHPLQEELSILIHSIQMGSTRSQAFARLADRTSLQPLAILASSVSQSEELGTGLGGLLRLQSESLRRELYRQAEEEAQKAPIKLFLPMVGLIFPVLFILLFLPIALRFFL